MNELVVAGGNLADLAVAECVDQARIALHYARDNFERVQVRDHAKAIQEAAAVLNRRDIQFEASVLVQKAERAIAKTNPPNPGGRGPLKRTVLCRITELLCRVV